MRKLLNSIDVFGAQVGFLVNNDPRHKTSVGAFGTLVFLTMIIMIIVSSMDSVYKKMNITVRSENTIMPQSDVMVIDNSNFMFAVQVFQDGVYYPMHALQLNVSLTSTKKQQLNLQPCNNTHFTNLNYYGDQIQQELDQVHNLSLWYCPLENFSFPIFRSVDFSDSFQTNIIFSTPKTLSTPQVNILIAYLEIQEYNSQPLVGHIFTEGHHLNSPTSMVETNFNFLKHQVTTDVSIYPNEDWEQQTYYLTSPDETFSQNTVTTQTTEILRINLQATRQLLTSRRQYEKIQKAISYLGGVFQVMRLLFVLIFSTYNSFDLWLKLSRQFFVMHVHESVLLKEDKTEKSLRRQPTQQIRRKAGNVFAFNAAVTLNEEAFEDIDEKIEQKRKLAVNKTPLSLSEFHATLTKILEASKVLVPKFRYYVAATMCRCMEGLAKNRIVFQMAIEIIHKDLDIFRYVQALSDIEKLKRLLLNEEQRQLFDFKQKQDVIVKKNPQGQLYVQKGFNIQDQEQTKNVRELYEPNAFEPMHVQLSMYEEVWKILIKLRNQQPKQDTLIYKINNGLIHFLRNDVKELFEQMLDQNDRSTLVKRYKMMRTSVDMRSDLTKSRRTDPKIVSQILPKEEAPPIKQQKTGDRSQLFQEIEMIKLSPARGLSSEQKTKVNQSTCSRTYIEKDKIYQEISSTRYIQIKSLFQEKLEIILIESLLSIDVINTIDWVEDQDGVPFGMLNSFIYFHNLSAGKFEKIIFNFQTKDLMKVQQEETINIEQLNRYHDLYQLTELKIGATFELATVYQVQGVHQIGDINTLTCDEFFEITNQRILITFTSKAKYYKVMIFINNSFLLNWTSNRPNKDVIFVESPFKHEQLFALGSFQTQEFYSLKQLFDQDHLIDKNELIDQFMKEHDKNDNDFDLEQHFEELSTRESILFTFVLKKKLLEVFALQCSRIKGSQITRDDFKCLMEKEYLLLLEFQYQKNNNLSIFYLSTNHEDCEPLYRLDFLDYYRERDALILITKIMFESLSRDSKDS